MEVSKAALAAATHMIGCAAMAIAPYGVIATFRTPSR